MLENAGSDDEDAEKDATAQRSTAGPNSAENHDELLMMSNMDMIKDDDGEALDSETF